MMNDSVIAFPAPRLRPLARIIATAARAASGLLAHVRETISGSRYADRSDDVAGMSVRMLRDIGAECAIGPRSMATRDLQYPRL
jgi:hypothetical protein